MPNIPGLGRRLPTRGTGLPKPVAQAILALLPLIVLAVIGAFAWRHIRESFHRPHVSTPAAAAPEAPGPPPVAQPASAPVPGPVTVATVEELEKPWSAKRFTFVKPDSPAQVPAMVVRLPEIDGGDSNAYWGFSLAAPYGSCNLEYITDIKQLAARYGYTAGHPMVAAPCDGTLFDPLRMGMTPAGAYVRGEVQQGPGIRPPISIRIEVKGRSLVADRME